MRDLIERQAAINTLLDMYCKCDEDGYVWIIRSDAWKRIDALPSAQPEQKMGEWVERTTHYLGEKDVIEEWQVAKCSVCGRYLTTPYLYFFHDYNYCPYCGADMRGEEDGF